MQKNKAIDFLFEKEAAHYLRISQHTLYVWRKNGKNGIPFFKIGRSIRYNKLDLDNWIKKNKIVN